MGQYQLMTLLVLIAALLTGAQSPAQVAHPDALLSVNVHAAPRLYGVIFEADADQRGKVSQLTVSKVIDPQSGSTAPIQLNVPEMFVAAFRTEISRRDYPPGKHFFTYGFYDPERPAKADISPKEGRP